MLFQFADPSSQNTFEPLDADFLVPIGVRMTFAPGEEIYAQDEAADLVYRLLRGCVRTTRVTQDGRRQIGDFYHAGELFGVEAGPTHCFAAEALSACEVLVVKKSCLRLYGEEGERFARLVWAAAALELQRAQKHVIMLGHRTTTEKIAHFVLDIADRSEGEVAHLPMCRQDIADYLGTTIETVSRTLSQMQVDGVLRFESQRRFRIRCRAALERLASA